MKCLSSTTCCLMPTRWRLPRRRSCHVGRNARSLVLDVDRDFLIVEGAPDGSWYRYTPVTGDPFGLAAARERMMQRGTADGTGSVQRPGAFPLKCVVSRSASTASRKR